MAFRHGSKAELTVNSVNLSAFCDSIELSISPETADVTAFGSTWRNFIPGLIGATLSASGSYDPAASTGPADAIFAAITAQNSAGYVAVVDKPGGTASGQRTNSFNAIVSGYTESSAVDDKVAFGFELTVTGAVTPVTQ